MNTQTEPKSILEQFTVVKRAIIYARVSTDEQAESGTSLDNQVEKSLAYAAAKGIRVVGDPFREDYTGKVLDRPELNKVRVMLRAGQADAMIVYKTNRLDRSEWGVNLLILMQELKTLGVELHYSQDGKQVDLNNPMEAFMYGNFAGWQAGEDHRETITKLKEGRYSRVRQGSIVLPKFPAFGYQKAKAKGKTTLEIVPEEAKIIELIYHLYVIEGLTFWAIAERLSSDGVPSPSDFGKAAKPRQKKKSWNVSTIERIIKNETYAGTWRYGKTIIVDGKRVKNTVLDDSLAIPVPAIVSREIWEAAQARLRQNKENAKRNRINEYLLSNHCTCDKCKYKMSGRTLARGYRYYYCPSSEGRSIPDCDAPLLRADKSDLAVWGWIEETLTDETKLELAIADYRAQMEKQNNPAREELAIVEELIAQNRENLDDEMINLRLVKGEIAKAEIAASINRMEETIKGLKNRRVELLDQIEATSLTDDQVLTIREFAAQVRADIETIRQDFDSKRAFLDLINLQARFTIEEGEKVVYITCKIGQKRLPIVSSLSKQNGDNRQHYITVTARLVIK